MIDVVIISSSRKRAIGRTQAVLDRYASRMGDATWTTKITAEGLETLRRALRRTASRNMAVLCMKREGRGSGARMRQAWVVGNRAFFGADWKTPVFVTKVATRARTVDRNAPAWIGDAKRVAAISGLFHDLGKNNGFFAQKILKATPIADPIRHEWLSTCLITTMLKTPGLGLDKAWAQAAVSANDAQLDKRELAFFPNGVPGPAEAVLACVATHHRLYQERGEQSKILGPNAFLRESGQVGERPSSISPALNREMAKPFTTDIRDEVARAMKWLLAEHERRPDYWRAITIMARAALILADHKVSSEQFGGKHLANEAYANSRNGKLNQPLRWHLQSVGRLAATMVVRMTELVDELDGLDVQALDSIEAPAEGRFAWQQTAADAIAFARSERATSPMLINVIASTGSGKTRCCARLAVRAAQGDKVRFATLLNLRALTLQTGYAYSRQLDVSESDLAVVIGDTMTRKAFEAQRMEDSANEDGMVRDLGEDIEIRGDPALLPEWLEHFIGDKVNLRAMISAPVLVSTADYMVAAGEPGAQARHIMPLLRLLSSDLVLDEIDNYDSGAVVAILRLIQMAALFGRNVIASSATLTPTLARAITRFYAHGAAMRAALTGSDKPDFVVATLSDMAEPVVGPFSTVDAAVEAFSRHVTGICAALRASTAPARRTVMVRMEKSEKGFFDGITHGVDHLHKRNAWLSVEHGKPMSVGLVRVANIKAAMRVAAHLRQTLSHFKPRIVCYHSRLFHGHRLIIERALDRMLNRTEQHDQPVHGHTSVRKHLERADVEQGMFIVVATPVEEVGRDHDFDWAVIEPSSSQSIVQTAGRVRRHRPGPAPAENVAILQFNFKESQFAETGKTGHPVFLRPGNEAHGEPFPTHDIEELLDWTDIGRSLDARVRFEDHRHFFSKLDNQATQASLNEPAMRMLELPSMWLSKFSYEGTAGRWLLRERKSTCSWRYTLEEGRRDDEGVWSRLDNIDGRWSFHEAAEGQAKWRTLSGEGLWLNVPLHEIVESSREIGVTPEWALEVDIAPYDNGFYTLDASCDGIIWRLV
jgi:CRISPR-associated endonuclease/helicase Cas3